MTTERKKIALACVECRSRKRKCQFDGGTRCVLCERRDIKCVMVSDGRKERPQNKRISDLESKIKHYRTVASSLRENLQQACDALKAIEDDRFRPQSHDGMSPEYDMSPSESGAMKIESPAETPSQVQNGTSLDARVHHASKGGNATKASKTSSDAPRKYFQAKTFQNAPPVSVSVYGPTSIFDTESLPRRELLEEHRPAALSKNPKIIECIKLFFRWSYPDMHAFIFREAFILDFFDPDSLATYSSTELVYAVCSVGASMSDDPEIRDSAHGFYCMARDLLSASLDSPSVCSLQAYLLLGLYDIYNYRNNAGWMLTGDALRMGLGIGFHLRPESWLVGTKKNVSDITISVRSRIFWGCFMADRFISLILGRPCVIKPDSSTIHVSENMPAIQWIQPYTYPGAESEEKVAYIDISNPLGSIIKLAEISDNMMETVFADKKTLQNKLELVQAYNKRITEWRANLPEILRWDRLTLHERGHDTTKMFTRYYFYIILLCLNRPFVEKAQTDQASAFDPISICMNAIADVHAAVYSFVKVHGARKCSILLVYSCIISASILLSKNKGSFAKNEEEQDFFFDFMTVLMHMSTTWKLSEVSFLKIRATLKSDHGLDYEVELQRHVSARSANSRPTIYDLLNRPSNNSAPVIPDLESLSTEREDTPEFGGFGDPSAWSSLFPDFFSAETF